MNAVILAVLVMLILATLRVHVVLSLFVGALVGGLSAGLGVSHTMVAFQNGLADGAQQGIGQGDLGAVGQPVLEGHHRLTDPQARAQPTHERADEQ